MLSDITFKMSLPDHNQLSYEVASLSSRPSMTCPGSAVDNRSLLPLPVPFWLASEPV